MSKPGRKKTPTPVLKLRGSWRAKNRRDIEVSGTPRRPRGMGAIAKRHWNDIVPEMARMGILAYIDWPKLYRMCKLWERIKKIEPHAENEFAKTNEKITTKKDGTIIRSGGNVIYNPAATRLDKLWDKYDKLASQFCMGSVNRAGMGGIQSKEKDDEKSKFFRKNG